jgi:Protein of unknown function (DUF3515)
VGAVACVAATTLAVSTLAAGCGTSPVDVGAPTRGPAECAELLDALPAVVDGQERREVEPADALAAAWGDPVIVLRCGVADPERLTSSSPCAEVNRVGWFAEQREDGYRFTTIGRSSNVQVQVPYEYEPAADALVDVADAVRSTVPEEQPCV